jgi:hypothetical protein
VSQAHQQKPGQQVEGSSWQRCKLQTFFAEKQHIRYFVIGERAADEEEGGGEEEESLDPAERAFFQRQDADVKRAGQDAIAAANTVHGFEGHRSAVVPWLDRRTGIAECVRGLDKDQIQASFALPKKDSESEPELVRILEVMDEVLGEAHS